MSSIVGRYFKLVSPSRLKVVLRHISISPTLRMSADKFITFNNGNKFPRLGLGTWQATKEEVQGAVRVALDAGYRHIDTAYAYGNEADIGEVLQEYMSKGKLKREDFYITTKLWITCHEPEKVLPCLRKSLAALKLDYVDLYLIHTPCAYEDTGIGAFWPTTADGKPAFKNVPVEDTWKSMEEAFKLGLAKNIGVSNFNSKQVERVCKSGSIKPVTNQVECHAYYNQKRLQDFCKKLGVTITSFGSLGSPGRPGASLNSDEPVLLKDPLIAKLAEKYKKSPGQLFDFKLTSDDLQQVLGLDKDYRYFKMEQGKDHPEYPGNEPF